MPSNSAFKTISDFKKDEEAKQPQMVEPNEKKNTTQ